MFIKHFLQTKKVLEQGELADGFSEHLYVWVLNVLH